VLRLTDQQSMLRLTDQLSTMEEVRRKERALTQ
jgi:hypothetical protein